MFPFPKNTDLLAELIGLSTTSSDLILDFFAGSGTTAHSVMKLNQERGTHRRYILAQIAEPTGREDFKSIAQITKERLRKAGDEIKQKSDLTNPDLDTGFRVLKIDTSNMNDVYYAPDAVTQENLLGQVDNIRADRMPEDLLFQLLVDWGLDL